MSDLAELKALAEAATPGLRSVAFRARDGYSVHVVDVQYDPEESETRELCEFHGKRAEADATYIAAASPDVILALIARVEEAEERAKELADELVSRPTEAERDHLIARAERAERWPCSPEEKQDLLDTLREAERLSEERRVALAGAEKWLRDLRDDLQGEGLTDYAIAVRERADKLAALAPEQSNG